MDERVFIDATGLFSFYQYEMMYSGDLKILARGREKTLTFDEASEKHPNGAVVEVLDDWGLLYGEYDDDPYDYDDVGMHDFAVINISDGDVESVDYLEWQELECHCACGKEVIHKSSPIPPGYGVSDQTKEE